MFAWLRLTDDVLKKAPAESLAPRSVQAEDGDACLASVNK